GGAITTYETRLKVAGGKWSAWGSQSATSSTGTFSKKWTGLKAAKGYKAQVRARNSAGTGASTSVTFTTAKK
ncbi:MAG: fibronectin type III domain-containing protein, partial [bacterium]